jgi:hypothetical protein
MTSLSDKRSLPPDRMLSNQIERIGFRRFARKNAHSLCPVNKQIVG